MLLHSVCCTMTFWLKYIKKASLALVVLGKKNICAIDAAFKLKYVVGMGVAF